MIRCVLLESHHDFHEAEELEGFKHSEETQGGQDGEGLSHLGCVWMKYLQY